MEPFDRDEEDEEQQPRNIPEEHRRRVHLQLNIRRVLRDTLDPLHMSTNEFFRLYRMTQHDFVNLVNILRPHMKRVYSARQIPVLHKVSLKVPLT